MEKIIIIVIIIIVVVVVIIICVNVLQVKKTYVHFLYHCYIDTEVDNKETFTKEHLWDLFRNFIVDIKQVSPSGLVPYKL